MANQLSKSIPVGDLQLYDNYVPALEAGSWRIEVTHTLSGVNTGALRATQKFVVSAPRFSLDSTGILNRYPPDGSTGLYGQVLPYIVLKDALLPWERRMAGSPNVQPWLAVLVLGENELVGGESSPTRTQSTTVAGFLLPDSLILKPAIKKEDDVTGKDPCAFIQLSSALFSSLSPRLEELRFLTHCRQSNITDKAEQGLEVNGLFSVVVGNRFPASPAHGSTVPVKTIAHLVSLEGLEAYLVDNPNFGGHQSVALLSLASWTFQTLPDNQEDFRGLTEKIVGQEFDGTKYNPPNLWLRIPPPSPAIDTTKPEGAEALKRISEGFVPMQYHTRTGEDTFAWYRGPLVPVLTTSLKKSGPFLTADSALVYQPKFGTFDASLATAWETGRALALSDRAFGQMLFDSRRQVNRLTDTLVHQLQSDSFAASQIADLSRQPKVQDEFFQVINSDLLQKIGTVVTGAQQTVKASKRADSDPKAAIETFLAQPEAQEKLIDLIGDEIDLIANWLGRLVLLYPVPFNLMVPDPSMLGPETLRFFYVDSNWLGALLDGALSIGIDSSRQIVVHTLTRDLIHRSAFKAARTLRQKAIGVEVASSQTAEKITTGFLLRSAVVSGWPNLAVRPGKKNGTAVDTLRIDHLAPNVLLCLFAGVPDYIEISEPQEGFRFGVDDDDGKIPLREPVSGATPLGTQLNIAFEVLPGFLRSSDTRVLNLAPTSSGGLIQKLEAALAAAGATVPNFGPSDFALQMVKSPEAIRFTTQTS